MDHVEVYAPFLLAGGASDPVLEAMCSQYLLGGHSRTTLTPSSTCLFLAVFSGPDRIKIFQYLLALLPHRSVVRAASPTPPSPASSFPPPEPSTSLLIQSAYYLLACLVPGADDMMVDDRPPTLSWADVEPVLYLLLQLNAALAPMQAWLRVVYLSAQAAIGASHGASASARVAITNCMAMVKELLKEGYARRTIPGLRLSWMPPMAPKASPAPASAPASAIRATAAPRSAPVKRSASVPQIALGEGKKGKTTPISAASDAPVPRMGKRKSDASMDGGKSVKGMTTAKPVVPAVQKPALSPRASPAETGMPHRSVMHRLSSAHSASSVRVVGFGSSRPNPFAIISGGGLTRKSRLIVRQYDP
jgi:hypothetical protein